MTTVLEEKVLFSVGSAKSNRPNFLCQPHSALPVFSLLYHLLCGTYVLDLFSSNYL